MPQTEAEKESQRRWRKTPNGRASVRRTWNKWAERNRDHIREMSREATRRYRATKAGQLRSRDYNQQVPRNIIRARTAIRDALQSGLIAKGLCFCGSADTQAHHSRGYEPEHHLTIEWLCTIHHAEKHPRKEA